MMSVLGNDRGVDLIHVNNIYLLVVHLGAINQPTSSKRPSISIHGLHPAYVGKMKTCLQVITGLPFEAVQTKGL